MKIIGIITAMEEEFEEIANIMSEVKEKEISKKIEYISSSKQDLMI